MIITPLDYDCNLVTLQCRKGGNSLGNVLGVCVLKVKTSRRNSLEPVCPVTSGFALLMYLLWIARAVFKLRTQCQQQSRSLPPTAAWECWRTFPSSCGGLNSAGAGFTKGVSGSHVVHVRAQQALPKLLWSSQNLGARTTEQVLSEQELWSLWGLG